MSIDRLLKKIKEFMEIILTLIVKIVILMSHGLIKLFSMHFVLFKKISIFYNDVKRVLGESFVAIFISIFGGIIAGVFLSLMTEQLEAFPGLMVLIPGAIGMRGNIFGALGSRLASNLHIGTLSPELKKSSVLSYNITASLILTLLMSIFLAFMARGLCILLGFESMNILDFTIISVLGGFFSSIILLPATILISLKSYENGWDPDNVTAPLISTAGDFFTIPSLFLGVWILLLIKNTVLEVSLFTIFLLIGLAGFFIGVKGEPDLKKIIKQSIPTLLICSLLGTIAGTILNSRIGIILDNPSILTLVPLFSGQGGNLASILGARLSSGLHSGYIEADLKPSPEAIRNFSIIILLAIILYPLIGFMAHMATVALIIPPLGLQEMVFISSIAGMLLLPLILLFTFYLSIASHKNGLDPDNIVIPLTTSLTDPLANTCLVLVVITIL
ncbi:MAG: magnesium transporter [Methanobacteriaceae archaeon]|nr:magnesium transporter [Methanobacteriaceae archaeon]MDP3623604.1 magnesium transporter [Methanobacteriaceae archaeon]